VYLLFTGIKFSQSGIEVHAYSAIVNSTSLVNNSAKL